MKLEYKQCPVCGCIHQHESGVPVTRHIRRVKPKAPDGTVIKEMGMCEKHHKYFVNDFIALVVVDKVSQINEDKMAVSDLLHSNKYVHLHKDAFPLIFQEPVGDAANEEGIILMADQIYLSLIHI